MQERHCNRCDRLRPTADFYSDRADGGRQYWCRSCYREWHRARYTPASGDDSSRACAWCGEQFRPKQRRAASYCCREHKEAARNARDRGQRLAAKPHRACAHCGNDLDAAMRVDAVYCSERCNSAAHQAGRRHFRPDRSAGKAVREQLLARDGSTCGICLEPLDPSAAWPDPQSTSFDHITPLALNGGNEFDNLRLTHLSCNCSRQTGVA